MRYGSFSSIEYDIRTSKSIIDYEDKMQVMIWKLLSLKGTCFTVIISFHGTFCRDNHVQ